MKSRDGFTLLEIIVVVALFLFIFSAILGVQVASNRSWQSGYNKIIEQQEARKAMEEMVKYLRMSKPEYVAIQSDANCTSGNKISFYRFIFNQTNQSGEPGPWVGFKANPDNCRELRRYGGDVAAGGIYLAGEIERVKFMGGDCTGCNCDFTKEAACASCTSVTVDCPLIKIQIATKRPDDKEQEFALESIVNLRNYNIPSSGNVTPPNDTQSEEGEF